MKLTDAPPGFGPTLHHVRLIDPSRRLASLKSVFWLDLGFAILMQIRCGEWTWTLCGVVFVLAFQCFDNFRLFARAGEGWFAQNNRFVRTDRLTKLRVRVTTFSGSNVIMRDTDGRSLKAPVQLVARDPEIWALVQAGAVRSVGRGLVVTDKLTARVFDLPFTPKTKRRWWSNARRQRPIEQTQLAP